jgi:hypothetical protein
MPRDSHRDALIRPIDVRHVCQFDPGGGGVPSCPQAAAGATSITRRFLCFAIHPFLVTGAIGGLANTAISNLFAMRDVGYRPARCNTQGVSTHAATWFAWFTWFG